MISEVLLALLASGGQQSLAMIYPDCSMPTAKQFREVRGPDLSPSSSFHTCSPLGEEGRQLFSYEGFAGEVVSFHLDPMHASDTSSAHERLTLSVSGPAGFNAEATAAAANELRVTLPTNGTYRVTVRSRDPLLIQPGGYSIRTEDHEAVPAPKGDCSRYTSPGGYMAIDMDPRPVAAGGSVRLLPVWSRHGRSYDVQFSCLTDWRVKANFAYITEENQTLHVGHDAPVGARIEVNATIAGQRLASFVEVAAAPPPPQPDKPPPPVP